MNINFKDMTKIEKEEYFKESFEEYVQAKMKACGYTENEARILAQSDFDSCMNVPPGVKQDSYILKILNNDEPVGNLWYITRKLPESKTAFLCEIYLKERYRGKGIGSLAIDLFEKRAKEEGCHRVSLHAFGYNEGAIRLYERLGYLVTDVTMQKSL